MSKNSISRRGFVANSAMTLTGLLMGIPALGNGLSANNTINVGVIGTGKRGVGLISLIQNVPNLKVIACCDVIPENLSNAIGKSAVNAKSYTDYRKLLDNKDIDAVIIATPLYLHYTMAKDALSAGKHVYVEKSMAFLIDQSLDLVKRVRDSKLIFQVGFQYRNYELYHKVKEIIDDGWLGKSISFECQYNRNSDWKYPVSDPKLEKIVNWRLYEDLCGGPLSELCAHEIDAVNYLLGTHPVKVVGMGSVGLWKDGRTTHDNVRTIYEYQNGAKATFTSILNNGYNGYMIRILGSKATVEILRNKAYIYGESTNNILGTVDGVTGATITNKTQGKRTEIIFIRPGEKAVEPTINALNDFAGSIINNRTPVSNVETGNVSAIAICMGLNAVKTETFQYWKPEYNI